MIRVTAHRHGRDPVDFSDAWTSINASSSIHQPWGGLAVSLALPMKDKRAGKVAAGDWLVVRDGDAPLGWGVIVPQGRAFTVDGQGALSTSATTLEAINWLAFLGHVEAAPLYDAQAGSVGTLYSPAAWSEAIESSLDGVQGYIGDGIDRLFGLLAQVDLPGSLGGAPALWAAASVVHDSDSAESYGPDITVDPVYGPTMAGVISSMPSATPVLNYIRAAAAGDPRMVEFFPSMTLAGSGGEVMTGDLGAEPVIVYRMKPWRSQGLQQWSSANLDRVPQSERFEARTWPTKRHRAVPADHLLALDVTQNALENFTAVTVGLPNHPDSPTKFWRQLGLPITNETLIRRYGLRICDVSWPFFGPKDESLVDHLYAVAAQASQWYLGGSRFLSGTAQLRYSPNVLAGESVDVTVRPGWTLRAYVETVSHRLMVDRSRGAIARRTIANLTRGLWDEQSRNRPEIA